jgi:hypothetical protein
MSHLSGSQQQQLLGITVQQHKKKKIRTKSLDHHHPHHRIRVLLHGPSFPLPRLHLLISWVMMQKQQH